MLGVLVGLGVGIGSLPGIIGSPLSGSTAGLLGPVPLLGTVSVGMGEFPLGPNGGITIIGGITIGNCLGGLGPFTIGPQGGQSWDTGWSSVDIPLLDGGSGKTIGDWEPS